MFGLFSLLSLKIYIFFKHWHEVEGKELTKESNLQNTELYPMQLAPREK